jgi:pimeloyl-ACP methyl ester carboxylesterase
MSTHHRSIILFCGMGADSRQFDPQRSLPYELITPEWIDPHEGESLPAFARRMVDQVDWPDRFILGGASFGGMIAAELVDELNPDAAVFISTTLSAHSIPSMYRFARMLAKAIPDQTLRTATLFSRPFLNIFRDFPPEDHELFADMLARSPVSRVRRATDMIFEWDGAPTPACPYVWVHGGKDLVIPIKKVQPTHVIPDAGHLMNWTHPEQTNAIIEGFIESL